MTWSCIYPHLLNADAPKNPVVLAHGLLGFDELRLAGRFLPGIQYWRGIREALMAQGVEVITATVPASASIEARAAELARDIEIGARGKDVNIIAYVRPNFIRPVLTVELGYSHSMVC